MATTNWMTRKATIKSSSGSTYTLDDVRWEVREEIQEAMIRGEDRGEVTIAESTYTWREV